MEKYNIRTLDELGRIVIPRDLQKKLGITIGDNLSIEVSANLIVMYKTILTLSNNKVEMSTLTELGYLVIPVNIRKQLGLKGGDKLAIYNVDELIILKQTESTYNKDALNSGKSEEKYRNNAVDIAKTK